MMMKKAVILAAVTCVCTGVVSQANAQNRANDSSVWQSIHSWQQQGLPPSGNGTTPTQPMPNQPAPSQPAPYSAAPNQAPPPQQYPAQPNTPPPTGADVNCPPGWECTPPQPPAAEFVCPPGWECTPPKAEEDCTSRFSACYRRKYGPN